MTPVFFKDRTLKWRVTHSFVSFCFVSLAVSCFPWCSGSDDDEVPPLSAKFADIYSMSPYSDPAVVAVMNGIHSDLNGGGENMALKEEVCGCVCAPACVCACTWEKLKAKKCLLLLPTP